jgi:8-oxo-dGTP pyrophosphatase MutT (NUDIX family)
MSNEQYYSYYYLYNVYANAMSNYINQPTQIEQPIQQQSRQVIKECGVILLNQSMEKVIFVLQRASKKWGLPKGHISDEEMEQELYYDCAVRELYEETGIILGKIRHHVLGNILWSGKLFYIIQIQTDFLYLNPLDRREICKARWIPIATIQEFTEQQSCNITVLKVGMPFTKKLHRYLQQKQIQPVEETYSSFYSAPPTHDQPVVYPLLMTNA